MGMVNPWQRAAGHAGRLAHVAQEDVFDSSRAVQELGYSFRPARAALAAAVEWFSQRPDR